MRGCCFAWWREIDVLVRYVSGRTAVEVAEDLFVAPATVHDHIRRIRAKYEGAGRPAKSKVDLYRRALEDGLLDEQAERGFPKGVA